MSIPETISYPELLMNRLITSLILCLILLGCSQQPEEKIHSFGGNIMGTTYQIKVVGQQLNLEHLKEISHRALVEVDESMSTYKSESELSQFNRAAIDEWFEISQPFWEVISLSDQISSDTNGAFDVTIGPLVDIWGFGPKGKPETIPSDESIQAAIKKIGFQSIELQSETNSIKKKKPLYINFSAVAKGYAVDRVALALESKGIEDYLVEVGGEMRGKGLKPNGSEWKVGIEAPSSTERKVQKVISLSGYGIATSGDYRNYYEENGVRYSHTIDGRTGKPIVHGLASVTVLDPMAAKADALATALMVMGPEKGLQFAEQNQIATYMIVRKDGQFVELSSTPFKNIENRD